MHLKAIEETLNDHDALAGDHSAMQIE